jgi:hypothetical protein
VKIALASHAGMIVRIDVGYREVDALNGDSHAERPFSALSTEAKTSGHVRSSAEGCGFASRVAFAPRRFA